jgi:hypothetical protein
VVCTAAGPAAGHPPPFFWMPDISGDRQVGADILVGPSDLIGDAVVLGASAFADIALTSSLSLNARLPISYADYEIVLGGVTLEDSGFGLGNLALGMRYGDAPHHHDGSRLLWALGARVSLPTASDGEDGAIVNSIARAFIVPDPARYALDTTTLRLSGDIRHEAEPIFFQAELALDFFLVQDDDNVVGALLGLGLGVKLNPHLALLGELTTVSDIFEDSEGENFVHTLDLGLRYHTPGVMMGVRGYIPLDDVYRDADVFGFGIDAAARF